MTTVENITPEQILMLRYEAEQHGDTAMAGTCELAIYGATEEIREAATAAVVEAINAADACEVTT